MVRYFQDMLARNLLASAEIGFRYRLRNSALPRTEHLHLKLSLDSNFIPGTFGVLMDSMSMRLEGRLRRHTEFDVVPLRLSSTAAL